MKQGDSPGGVAENQRDTEPHQKCDLLASFSSNPNHKKEKLLNNTLIQLNSMCHIHNRHAIKMTNISLPMFLQFCHIIERVYKHNYSNGCGSCGNLNSPIGSIPVISYLPVQLQLIQYQIIACGFISCKH